MHKVLVVEDEIELQSIISESIVSEFSVTCVNSKAAALDKVKTERFDIFLVDVNLPDGSGFEVCKFLKSKDSTKTQPVLFLTGSDSGAARVQGFDVGADDYILKPFLPDELLARLRVRTRVNWSNQDDRFGRVRVDWEIQKIFVRDNGEERDIFVTPLEFRIFAHLCRSKNKTISREDLRNGAWGKSLNIAVRSVDKHVCILRSKLGASGRYIETVPGSGYRFSVGRD